MTKPIMIIQCTEIDEYDQDYDMRLYYDNEIIATVKVVFVDSNLVDTSCMLEVNAVNIFNMSPLFATMLVTHTLISSWDSKCDSIATLFSNGSLIVNPDLYKAV